MQAVPQIMCGWNAEPPPCQLEWTWKWQVYYTEKPVMAHITNAGHSPRIWVFEGQTNEEPGWTHISNHHDAILHRLAKTDAIKTLKLERLLFVLSTCINLLELPLLIHCPYFCHVDTPDEDNKVETLCCNPWQFQTTLSPYICSAKLVAWIRGLDAGRFPPPLPLTIVSLSYWHTVFMSNCLTEILHFCLTVIIIYWHTVFFV